jgi:uncharacterized membrane protein HdeD (DUF308 family)
MLLKIGFPLIISGAFFLILNHFSSEIGGNIALVVFGVILMIAFILSLVMAIVGCHRIFLLGPKIVDESSLLNWTGNEIKYIGWWVLIGLCTALVALPFMFIFMPFIATSAENLFDNQVMFFTVIGLINIPIYYVASRWSLVLPSSAIDKHGKSLTWSWGISSGNGWRLTLLIGFLPYIMDILFSLLPTYDSMIFTLLHGLVWLVVGVIEIGLLSLSYNFLVNNEITENSDV